MLKIKPLPLWFLRPTYNASSQENKWELLVYSKYSRKVNLLAIFSNFKIQTNGFLLRNYVELAYRGKNASGHGKVWAYILCDQLISCYDENLKGGSI